MKGIILAGGKGTRLKPLTSVVCKQLLPIYNKPMIYYPLSTLKKAGITDIAIITNPEDRELFIKLLGDGSSFGCKLTYFVQEKPEGLPQAFLICEEFIDSNNVTLILGDNLFHGSVLQNMKKERISGAKIYGYQVHDPERYGVVEFENSTVLSIEEKPKNPKSNYAIPGLYTFDSTVVEKAKRIKKSDRGEYEIVDVLGEYLSQGKLTVEILDEGIAWLDTGTFDSLLQASHYVEVIEKRQGIKIGEIH